MKDKRVQDNLKALRYKKKNAAKVVRARRNNKMELIAYKGGKCEGCGYCKPFPSAYHFHHEDPNKKDFTVSRFMSRNLERLKQEVDKCKILCSNCHAEHHDRITEESLEKTIATIAELSQLELQCRAERKKAQAKKNICKYCQKSFNPGHTEQLFCSVGCRGLAKRRANRPTSQELLEMHKTKSWTQIGKEYGVSDNAVRKWMK